MPRKKEKEICCVCLTESPRLANLVDRDVDHVDYYEKLSSCIPEIEWQRSFRICSFCTDLLDTVYTFRKNCIKSDEDRRKQLSYDNTEKPSKEPTTKTKEERTSKHTREITRRRGRRVKVEKKEPPEEELDIIPEPVAAETVFDEIKDEKKEENLDGIKDEDPKVKHEENGENKTTPDFVFELFADDIPDDNDNDGGNIDHDESDDEFDENMSLSDLLKERKFKIKKESKKSRSPTQPSKKIKLKVPKKEMSCERCGFTTTSKSKLIMHCEEEHDMDARDVQLKKRRGPKKGMKKKIKVPREMREKKTAPTLTCEQCPFTSTDRPILVEHCMALHGINAIDVKPYKCDVCPGKFTSYVNLYQHKKIHEDIRSKMCSYCGKGFITKSDLVTHEKRHLNKREYACDVCGKSFNTHKNLSTHKFIVHTDSSQWKHVCEVCHKRFPIKSNYDSHIKRHTGERNFECQLCQKKFTDKCVLQRHMKTHSNAREFKCSVCGKEYRDARAMKRHMARVHLIGVGEVKMPSRERKHQCHICTKAYYDKNKLTRHLYVHTGEKPFACSICNKAFNDRSYLKQHLIKSHGMDQDTALHITPQRLNLSALHYPTLGVNFGNSVLGNSGGSIVNTSIGNNSVLGPSSAIVNSSIGSAPRLN